jgi:hypothetical protein
MRQVAVLQLLHLLNTPIDRTVHLKTGAAQHGTAQHSTVTDASQQGPAGRVQPQHSAGPCETAKSYVKSAAVRKVARLLLTRIL